MAKAKRRRKGSKKAKSSRRKRKATPAQMRALKKAWAARRKQGKAGKKKAAKKKPGPKSAVHKKRLENLKKARAARELKNMPKTQRMALKQLHHDMMAETVRVGALPGSGHFVVPASAPSILHRVRRRPAPTLMSRYN